MSPPLVVASNRGPLSFAYDADGRLTTRRGGGGLVSCLGPAITGSGATWIASAISDADREAAASGIVEAEGLRTRSLVIDPDDYRAYYDVVSNSTLWFLFHNLFDAARRPRFDRRWREAWDRYRAVNETFATALADEAAEGATVLVHDYHLALVGGLLAERRPDLRSVYFHHTPFCEPSAIRMLPVDVGRELLAGLAANTACGFHTERWARAFRACCEEVLGEAPTTFVSPAATDPSDIRRVASSEACQREFERLDALVGDRKLVVRVDRLELSKNILRGLHAFEELLETRPEWRERVVFWARAYPSRENLPEYLAYRQEIETLTRRVNRTWQTPTWTPVLLDAGDDFPRSVAAFRRYDVLLVNPVRDGLNLVAKEGPLVNERDGVLCLSRESGVWDEVGSAAVGLNPFDVSETAAALATALEMTADERRDRAAELRRLAEARGPQDWLDDQVAAAG